MPHIEHIRAVAFPWLAGLAILAALRSPFFCYEYGLWRLGYSGRRMPVKALLRLHAPAILLLGFWLAAGGYALATWSLWHDFNPGHTSWTYLASVLLALSMFAILQAAFNRLWPLPFDMPRDGSWQDPHFDYTVATH